MSWDDLKKSENGNYLRISDGNKVRVHILGQHPKRRVIHSNATGRPTNCTGEGCSLCAEGVKKNERWSIPVFNLDLHREQIFEQGKALFLTIKEIREAYGGNLEKVDLMISRQGAGPTDTRYTAVPVPTMYMPEMLNDKNRLDVPF